jgi:hypothetical protein
LYCDSGIVYLVSQIETQACPSPIVGDATLYRLLGPLRASY